MSSKALPTVAAAGAKIGAEVIGEGIEAGLVLLSMSSVGLTQSKKWLTNMDRVFMPSPPYKPGVAAKKFLQIWKLSTVYDVRESGNSYQLGTKAKSGIEFDSLVTPDMVPWIKAALAQVQAIGNFKTVAVDVQADAERGDHGPSESATDADTDF